MEYYVGYLKDTFGKNYIGVDIPIAIIESFLIKLESILGSEFDTYSDNRKNRDGDHYHITVINVRDFNMLSKKMGMKDFINSLELIFKYTIDDIEMLGIGKSSNDENTTYYVVCNSFKLDAIRDRYNLPKHDFHITLGFDKKDVFGVRKNQIITK